MCVSKDKVLNEYNKFDWKREVDSLVESIAGKQKDRALQFHLVTPWIMPFSRHLFNSIEREAVA